MDTDKKGEQFYGQIPKRLEGKTNLKKKLLKHVKNWQIGKYKVKLMIIKVKIICMMAATQSYQNDTITQSTHRSVCIKLVILIPCSCSVKCWSESTCVWLIWTFLCKLLWICNYSKIKAIEESMQWKCYRLLASPSSHSPSIKMCLEFLKFGREYFHTEFLTIIMIENVFASMIKMTDVEHMQTNTFKLVFSN